jgi:FkbM family methyltransferase
MPDTDDDEPLPGGHPHRKRRSTPFKRLKYAAFVARTFTNWREILECRKAGRSPSAFRMRSGLIIARAPAFPIPIVSEVFRKRVYAPPGFEIAPDDTVLDIGAHIGIFTLFAARQTQAGVYSYEASPINFECLSANIAANGFEHVHPAHAAVADRTGTLSLYLQPGTGANRISDVAAEAATAKVEVQAVTLGNIFETHNLQRLDLVKMDCEGAEGLILPSASTEDLSRIRRLMLEFHDHLSPLRHDELERLLQSAGFQTRLDWNGKRRCGYIYARRS